jgi:hypothetical protein
MNTRKWNKEKKNTNVKLNFFIEMKVVHSYVPTIA